MVAQILCVVSSFPSCSMAYVLHPKLATPFPTGIINIPAGATVGTEWHHGLQPNGYNPSDLADPIEDSHKGPIMVYLAK